MEVRLADGAAMFRPGAVRSSAGFFARGRAAKCWPDGSLDTARPAPSGGRRAQSGRYCAGRAPSRDDWCQD